MRIIDIGDSKEVVNCLLSNDSFFTTELPNHVDFEVMLNEIYRTEPEIKIEKSWEGDNLNYHILLKKSNNSWRKLTIVNPVKYVEGVKLFADNWKCVRHRFNELIKEANDRIKVYSIPSIQQYEDGKYKKDLSGWDDFNRDSRIKATEYNFISETDISNFYGSIYTHSIDWAVRTREIAKKKRKNTENFGSKLDKYF